MQAREEGWEIQTRLASLKFSRVVQREEGFRNSGKKGGNKMRNSDR